jgi:hypothetical protein
MKFNQQLDKSQSQGEPKNTSRRSFLKHVGSALGAAAVLVGAGKVTEEIARHEHKVNALHNHFSGNEQSFVYAEEAATLLSLAMKREGLTSIRTVGGTYASNELIELRDFLTSHMTSRVASRYHVDATEVFSQGVFTEESLQKIQKEARTFVEKDGDAKYRVSPK